MSLKYPSSGMDPKELDAVTGAIVELMELWVDAGLIVTPGLDHNLLITMTHAVETALIDSSRGEVKPLKRFEPPESRWVLSLKR